MCLTNAFSTVPLYLFKSSWRTGSRVYLTPGFCSLVLHSFHWRRAPVVSLEVFSRLSTRSRCFRSYRSIISVHSPASPAHFSALLPLANSWISIAVFADVCITYVAVPTPLGVRIDDNPFFQPLALLLP